MKRFFTIVLSLVLLAAISRPLSGQDLVIVHTNDFHSQIEPFQSGRNAGTAGLLSLSGYLEESRMVCPDLLYLDAGD